MIGRTLALLSLAGLMAGATTLQAQTSKRAISRPGARPSVLSAGTISGDLVYTSGQLGTDSAGKLAEGGIQPQTRQALENVKGVLGLAGGQMEDVLKCTVFLTDVKDFGAMNEVYRTFFPNDPPARSTVVVAALVAPGAVIEIECIAARRK